MSADGVIESMDHMIERIEYYDDVLSRSNLIEMLKEWKKELQDEEEHLHDECFTGDQVAEAVRDATSDLEDERDRLEARIEELEKGASA